MQDLQTDMHPEQDQNVAVAEMRPETPMSEQPVDAVNAPRSTDQALSQREKQVVRMIGGGKTVGQIAVELNLSVKTVSTYRVRALHKLGMTTNADLMRYAIQHKLEDAAAAEADTAVNDMADNNAPMATHENESEPVGETAAAPTEATENHNQ